MFSLSIKPQWQLESLDGRQLLPRLVELLGAIHETGSLALACRHIGLSYRYAWGLLKDGDALFGAPLVLMSRGRGASLSPLAEKLVWADKRISARLSPLLDSLASELEVELQRALSATQPILRMQASHGFAVETLREWFSRAQIPLDLKYCTSFEAVAALTQSGCDIAGFHVPMGEYEQPTLQAFARWIRPQSQSLIHLATRRQGIMLAAHNPKGIHGLSDFTRADVRFVNRQPGSATRHLLDLMLKHEKIDARRIHGHDNGEFTHAAVAAYVASDMADVGFGVETAAKRFGLDFLPVVTERYFFLCQTRFLQSPLMERMIETLRSDSFRLAVNSLPGYDAANSGQLQTIVEAFDQSAKIFRNA
ncbi:MAG: LysR family transcriptional regulator [Nevskia sp.]|nr:LysR family transcriptional regulator [Nevskia sp.]